MQELTLQQRYHTHLQNLIAEGDTALQGKKANDVAAEIRQGLSSKPRQPNFTFSKRYDGQFTRQQLQDAVDFRMYQIANSDTERKRALTYREHRGTSRSSSGLGFWDGYMLAAFTRPSSRTTVNVYNGGSPNTTSSRRPRNNKGNDVAGIIAVFLLILAILTLVGYVGKQAIELWRMPGESKLIKKSKIALSLALGAGIGCGLFYGLCVPAGYTAIPLNLWLSAGTAILLGVIVATLAMLVAKNIFWPIGATDAIKPLEDAGILRLALAGKPVAQMQIKALVDTIAKTSTEAETQANGESVTPRPPPEAPLISNTLKPSTPQACPANSVHDNDYNLNAFNWAHPTAPALHYHASQ